MKRYDIAEIFYSVQGEGIWTGQPMVFVRMAGCNLSCSWCDTSHKLDESLTASQIMKRVQDLAPPGAPVCFTGGEPTLSIDKELVCLLSGELSCQLHIETNGLLPVPEILRFVSVVVSPKIPAREVNRWGIVKEYWTHHTAGSILKLVYDVSPGFHLNEILEDWGQFWWDRQYLQPLWFEGTTNEREVLEYVQEHPEWLISTQQHKKWGVC